jgi:hypothetical protein
MEDFEVTGTYTHRGIEGNFLGAFRFFDDDRFVGTMNDSGADIVFNKGRTKLVMGIRDERNLNFWKISPSPYTAPLVYAMEENQVLSGREKRPIYDGKWVPVSITLGELVGDENTRFLEVLQAFNSNSIGATLYFLEKIEKSRIKNFLNPDLIRDIKREAKERGHLELSRSDFLSRGI